MATATLTSKGQVTIPLDVRERLNLEAGTRIEFVEATNGELKPCPRVLFESLGVPAAAASSLASKASSSPMDSSATTVTSPSTCAQQRFGTKSNRPQFSPGFIG
jgi:AbrB family looped-hinge helix DNA binding protein